VEGKDKAKRRRYYRLISKEKLRLAEKNIDQALINAVCRYLINLGDNKAQKVHQLMGNPQIQLELLFS
jgi:hypothetical protein